MSYRSGMGSKGDDDNNASSLPIRDQQVHHRPRGIVLRAPNLRTERISNPGADSDGGSPSFIQPSPAPAFAFSRESQAPSSSQSPVGQPDPGWSTSKLRPDAPIWFPPIKEAAGLPKKSITLMVMHKKSHFFLTIDLSIKLELLKVKIMDKLRRLGPDRNIGEMIPGRTVISTLVVVWNVTSDMLFPRQTVINDGNIELLLLFMKEKKTAYEVVRVDTGKEIRDQTEGMEETKS